MLLGGDVVDYIMSRMTDQSKSRRQVIRQLVHLELISSAKDLKKTRSPLIISLTQFSSFPSVLPHGWLGDRKGIWVFSSARQD